LQNEGLTLITFPEHFVGAED